MKQVSNAKNSLVLTSPLQNPIHQRRSFSNWVSIFLFLCIALFITSCQKESLQSISQSPDQLTSSQKQKAVPFNGKFEIIEEPLTDTTDRITGTGEGTHIGKFTLEAIVNFVNFPHIMGTDILTAANGDKIYGTISGFIPDPDANGIVYINNLNIITGGTGRFKNATGSFIVHANSSTATNTFDGTISY